ncbi:hypothetical protein LCGC14_2573990 [marine sediment metagenome]|uniref:Uncharacterized protein n=1 Tax=marine sediment metagenome TaxID=412755 RepID=A0A0F9CSL5_9ZZZZ
MDSTTQRRPLAIIKAQPEDAAEARYRAALKTGQLVVVSRMAGEEYTWIVQVA